MSEAALLDAAVAKFKSKAPKKYKKFITDVEPIVARVVNQQQGQWHPIANNYNLTNNGVYNAFCAAFAEEVDMDFPIQLYAYWYWLARGELAEARWYLENWMQDG